MNKKEAILLSVVLLVGLSFLGAVGCGGSTTPTTTTPFISGTNGVLMSFTTEAPPKEVYDGGTYPFDIVIQLTNDGEWGVKKEDAMVRILGLDPADFGKTAGELVKQPLDDLEGKTKEPDTGATIQGTTTTVEFTGLNYKGKTAGNMQMPIFADICYTYGTNVASQLCIKKDPTDTSSNVCKIEEDKVIYSSGAPIQVTKLHQSLRGKNIVGFTFTIQKKGNGNVYSKGSRCNTEGILYENKVWVEVSVPEMSGTKCTGLQGGTDSTGFVTLYTGQDKSGVVERTVSCTQPAPTETDYTKNIDITLVYDYREDISTSLVIKHTPN